MSNKNKPCGDSRFAMDGVFIDDTVMRKIANRNLNFSTMKVYMYLARNRNLDTGKLHSKDSNYPNMIEDIADYWEMDKRTVYRAIADLIDAELYIPPNRTGVDSVEGTLLPNRKDKPRKGDE